MRCYGYTYLTPSITSSDWQLEMNRVLALAVGNKIVIAQTPTSDNVTDRFFVFGTYLLTKGKQSYINMLSPDGTSLNWWPDYDIDLGVYSSPPPSSISNLLDNASGAYVRAYAKGNVYVNPDSSPLTIQLTGTW